MEIIYDTTLHIYIYIYIYIQPHIFLKITRGKMLNLATATYFTELN